ncbi:MAG: MBL fold metallo-hydrolase, partial [Ktedonobacteraceae bacterium]|nr:MBL fold metallo-hydrolase [Ktedonobacteraceae bacterium]
MSSLYPLPAVDGVEITTIMDNTLDLVIASTPVAQRFPLRPDLFSRQQLRAEHGLSLLVTILNQGRRETILFDTGVTPDGALHNLELLGVDLLSIQSIILSHGHTDHTQGLT